jgi:hypothetical protein
MARGTAKLCCVMLLLATAASAIFEYGRLMSYRRMSFESGAWKAGPVKLSSRFCRRQCFTALPNRTAAVKCWSDPAGPSATKTTWVQQRSDMNHHS